MAILAAVLLGPGVAWAQTGGIAGTVKSGATLLAGVRVDVYNSAEVFVGSAAPTNAAGAYSLAGLAPGTYYAFAYSGNLTGGYVDALYPNTQCTGSPVTSGTYCRINTGGVIAVSAGTMTSAIDFDLPVGGTISGVVTAGGVTYSGSSVELHVDGGFSTALTRASTSTSASGAYQFTRLAAGNYYVWAGNVTGGAATGYVSELFDNVTCPKSGFGAIPMTGAGCSIAAATAVPVVNGNTTGVGFDLAPGGAIRGRLIGAGLPRPSLQANAAMVGNALSSTSPASEQTGGYLLKGLPPGPITVTGSGFGYLFQTAGATTVTVGAIATGPNFDLAPAAPNLAYSSYQPQGRSVMAGQPTTLSVTATGQAPLFYQWYRGVAGDFANPIAGATGRDYTTPPVFVVENYWVRISNSLGALNSQTATVNVVNNPSFGALSGTITSGGQPVANAVVNVYSSAEQLVALSAPTSAAGAFSVAALAPGNYYAFVSSGAVAGNVTGTLVAPADYPYADVLYPNIPCVGVRNTGTYCRISSGLPITVAANAVTTGIDVDLPMGGLVTGTITAAGALPGQLGTSVSVIVDVLGQSYLAAVGHVDALGTLVLGRLPAGLFRVVAASAGMITEVWDDVKCLNSNCLPAGGTPIAVSSGGIASGVDFDLDPAPPRPLIMTQPENQAIQAGQVTTLVVAAVGQTPLFYQWYVGVSGDTSNPIPGATSASYTTGPVGLSTNFWVRVTNYGGFANSDTATVDVNVGGMWRTFPPGGGGVGSGTGGGTTGPPVPGGSHPRVPGVSPGGGLFWPGRESSLEVVGRDRRERSR